MNNQSRIGPNSIIQTVAALESMFGKAEAEAILQRIGQGQWIGNLPTEMTEESKFHELTMALEKEIGEKATASILEESGERTAKYLLRVRIPALFQRVVKLLWPRAAFRLLFFAISKNAWTFAGSGEFSYRLSRPPEITVRVTYASIPVVSNFYLGTFKALLQELVNPEATLTPDIRKESGNILCRYSCDI
ncbi:MAG: bacteriochlorophyll 4-vinyl reductase [Chlorobiaceae bacterium]